MTLTVAGVMFMMLCILVITAVGYALGRITIKGVNLGTAGVFLVALVFGCIFFEPLKVQLDNTTIVFQDGTKKKVIKKQ